MKRLYSVMFLIALVFLIESCSFGGSNDAGESGAPIVVGAERFDEYLDLLKDKRVGILTNQTAVVKDTHLIDTLLALGVHISKIFGPEHGFRSSADAGALVDDEVDGKTGIPVVSLWGKHLKPTPEELMDVDVMVYDIQDVGTRFYTYISSLQWFMEAAADNGKEMIILDRPNPNGFYVDGPVLKDEFLSPVGQQPVPIVYGMTIGEYAKMMVGEGWLKSENKNLNLEVIECLNYNHDSLYVLPVAPSPNLPNMTAVYLYPSLCFFEGTVCSEGRGTPYPFQLYGHPAFADTLYSFTPKSVAGASKPKLMGKECFGFLIAKTPDEALRKIDKRVQLRWIMDAFERFPEKDSFFIRSGHFDNLAGSDLLRKQIIEGKNEGDIRKEWENDLAVFKGIRKKYLLYPNFTGR